MSKIPREVAVYIALATLIYLCISFVVADLAWPITAFLWESEHKANELALRLGALLGLALVFVAPALLE